MRLLSSLFAFLVALVALTEGFTNPIKSINGSDPYITFWNGYYYLLTTTWEDLQVTKSATIEGLKTATPVTVFKDSNPARCCNVWAPELHRIDDQWYIYYIAGPNGTDVASIQKIWALQGGSGDPLDSPYTFLSQIIPPDNDIPILDGSVYPMSNGVTYFLYSAWGDDGQSIWIAELLAPDTLGPSTKISVPTYDWEVHLWEVNEGPIGITHGQDDFVVFSASSCATQYYALGLLTLAPGADPLDANSWTKSPEPIFESANDVWGPAHGAFFKSPDGTEDWNVFHANENVEGGCDGGRQTYVQPMSWNSDGTPNLGEPLPRGTEIAPPSGERGGNSTQLFRH